MEWLNRADDDLGVIKEIIDNINLTNMVAFDAQQAAEKILKAIMKLVLSKPTSLNFCLKKIKIHIPFDIDLAFIKRLDEVYTETRYPADLGLLPYGKPKVEEVKKFYNFAEELFKNAESYLNDK